MAFYIDKESQIRRFVQKVFRDDVFWIEHRSGGTRGMPDCMIIIKGGGVRFVELKMGYPPRTKLDRKYGVFNIKLRPEQKATHRRLISKGLKPYFFIGMRETELVLALSSEEVLAASEQWVKTDPTGQLDRVPIDWGLIRPMSEQDDFLWDLELKHVAAIREYFKGIKNIMPDRTVNRGQF